MSKAANPGDPARLDLGWGQSCTPIHSPETGRPAMTVASKARGAVTTKGKARLHLPLRGTHSAYL